MFFVNRLALKVLTGISVLLIGFTSGYSYCNSSWKEKNYESILKEQNIQLVQLQKINSTNESIIYQQNHKIQKFNSLAERLQNEISQKDANLRNCSYTPEQLRIIRDSAKGYSLQNASSTTSNDGESTSTTVNGRVYSCSDGIKLLIEQNRICHMYQARISSWEDWYNLNKANIELSEVNE